MAEFITLVCPSCGGKVKVSPNTRSYICDYCGNEHLLTLSDKDVEKESLERLEIPQPESITYEQDGRVLKICRRWFSLKYVPLAFFCVAWDAFLIFWYAMALGTNGAPWIMVVFPIAHVAIGIGLTYSTLAGFLNHTNLEVTPEKFSTFHGPIPWGGQITLPIREISQFYTRQNFGSKDTHSFDLYVNSTDGKSRKVLSNLDSPDIPLFIEQHLEKWLDIRDVPVAGEFPR